MDNFKIKIVWFLIDSDIEITAYVKAEVYIKNKAENMICFFSISISGRYINGSLSNKFLECPFPLKTCETCITGYFKVLFNYVCTSRR